MDKNSIRIIPNFLNYQIDTKGNVFSLFTNKYLKQCKNNSGYLYVCLFKNKKGYYKAIHRLMLETFVGLCPKGMICRHLNGNKQDNKLDNLCWSTRKENMADKVKHGTMLVGEKNPNSKLKESDVRMIIYMYRTRKFTQQEIAGIYNISFQHISDIVNKRRWKHIWRN